MKVIVPDYYLKFQCTASGCRHNCCREGWEILLDDAACKRYQKRLQEPEKDYADLLKKGLYFPAVRERREGKRSCIRLMEDGSCPFLNEAGLCRLILCKGEKELCQICRDHPRFRNYYSDTVELGVGLCCEEAARLILTQPGEVVYLDPATGKQAVPYHRKHQAEERVQEQLGREIKEEEWIGNFEYLLQQEHLENRWPQLLREAAQKLKDHVVKGDTAADRSAESRGLLEYLLFRHFGEEGVEFSAFCYLLLLKITEICDSPIEETCRLFSTEIEYCEENRNAVIKLIQKIKAGKGR